MIHKKSLGTRLTDVFSVQAYRRLAYQAPAAILYCSSCKWDFQTTTSTRLAWAAQRPTLPRANHLDHCPHFHLSPHSLDSHNNSRATKGCRLRSCVKVSLKEFPFSKENSLDAFFKLKFENIRFGGITKANYIYFSNYFLSTRNVIFMECIYLSLISRYNGRSSSRSRQWHYSGITRS